MDDGIISRGQSFRANIKRKINYWLDVFYIWEFFLRGVFIFFVLFFFVVVVLFVFFVLFFCFVFFLHFSCFMSSFITSVRGNAQFFYVTPQSHRLMCFSHEKSNCVFITLVKKTFKSSSFCNISNLHIGFIENPSKVQRSHFERIARFF